MGITGKERAYIVRNYVGTPDSTRRGLASDVTNALFMYSNVIVSGLVSDAEVASEASSAAGYWLRSVLVDFGPKALMAAAALGFLGKEIKEWYDRVPSYDMEKYIIIPVPPFYSTNAKGDRKAIYFRLPHDDVNRMLAATTWALLVSERPSSPTHAVGVIAGEFPGLNPGIDLAIKTGQLAAGRNPYDTFRGRNVVPRTQWDAGGWHRWKEMGRHALGEFGIISQLTGRFTYGSPLEGEAAPGEQFIRSVPGLSSLIKITDRGLREGQYWELDWDAREGAQRRMDLQREVRSALSERNRLNALGEARLDVEQEERRRRGQRASGLRDRPRFTQRQHRERPAASRRQPPARRPAPPSTTSPIRILLRVVA
jgi:hypothetical protein